MEDGTDHNAICDTVYAFAEGMDARDWTLYRSVFTDTVDIDYSFFHPDQKASMAAEDWVANVERRLTRLDGTQHSMTNPRVERSGGSASGGSAECRIHVQAHHLHRLDGAPAWCLLGGRYRFRLVQDDARWRIAGVTLGAVWVTGDTRILDVARAD